MQILKPLIAESYIVLAEELGLHKSPLIFELGITGLYFAFGLGNKYLNYIVLSLENQEIGSIHSHVLPKTPIVSGALDLEFGQHPIPVVVNF